VIGQPQVKSLLFISTKAVLNWQSNKLTKILQKALLYILRRHTRIG
jgi:hypothetical protein